MKQEHANDRGGRRILSAFLIALLLAAGLPAQTPAPQGAPSTQSPEFVPTSKKLCATVVALGEALAQSAINMLLAALNQTSPPELPKMLQLKLCAYCDICVSNECFDLKTPSEARRLIRQQIRNSLGQLGGALSLLPEGPSGAATGLPAFMLNTSLSEARPNGGFEQAPNTVDFLDVEGIEVQTRIDLDAGLPDGFYEPQDMALSEDGETLVVVSRGSDPEFFPNGPPPHLTIIDVPSQTLTKRIMLDPIDFPSHVVVSPDGRRAYVSSPLKQEGRFIDGAALVEVDLMTDRVARRLTLPFETGGGSGDLVITPDGALLVVILNDRSGGSFRMPKLAVIDAPTLTISATYPNESSEITMARRFAWSGLRNLAMDPTGSRVYVSEVRALQTAEDSQTLAIGVFDLATAEPSAVFPVPGAESGGDDDIQLYDDGLAILLTDARTGSVFGVDAITGEVRMQEKVTETFFMSEIMEGQ